MVPRVCAFLIGLLLVGGGLEMVQLQLGGEEAFAELRKLARAEARGEGQGLSAEDVRGRLRFVDGVVDWIEGHLPLAMGGLLLPGVSLLGFALWPRGRRSGGGHGGGKGATEASLAPALSRRELRNALKNAAQLAQEHGPERAGDFLIGAGLRDQALDAFLKAELWERAAELRCDQNRFEESAELYE